MLSHLVRGLESITAVGVILFLWSAGTLPMAAILQSLTAVAAIFFLSWAVHSRDNRDAEIARLKKANELLDEQVKAKEDRLVKEIQLLEQTIREREAAIVRLDADMRHYRDEAIQYEALAKTRESHQRALLEENRKAGDFD